MEHCGKSITSPAGQQEGQSVAPCSLTLQSHRNSITGLHPGSLDRFIHFLKAILQTSEYDCVPTLNLIAINYNPLIGSII